MATSRNTHTQPTYDFLTGSESPLSTANQQFFKQSQMGRPDLGNQDLRAEIKALQYELSTFKQERELVVFRHDKELSDLRVKAEADFKRAQAAESESHIVSRKYEALTKELSETQESATNAQAHLERELRTNQDRIQVLEEEVEEARTDLEAYERQSTHQVKELQRRTETLEESNRELRQEVVKKVNALQDAQQRLSQRETVVGELESEVLRLKAQTGDADTLGIIKRELSEQVAHIKKLESTNREQLIELKQYRRLHKSIEIVEEEKRGLENKLRIMDDLRRELSEAKLQKQILEDERKSWSLYLQNELSSTGQVEYESPEAFAKALAEERLENAALMEKLGGLKPELSEKDNLIRSLEAENAKLRSEIEKLRASGGSGHGGSLARLERQKKLAIKEVEFLRAQLKTFDTEETTFRPEQFNEEKTSRIQELESLVDQYRSELQKVNEELKRQEESAPQVAERASTKRPREEEQDERLGLLSRKNRKLQDEASKYHQTISLLEKELEIAKSQIQSLQSTSRTRILELRSNPTSNEAAIKQSTLTSLRAENAALLAQLEGQYEAKVVPISVLDNARQTIEELKGLIAEKEKRMTRLREIWTAKALEFREAVASILGWRLDIMPNGRVRVASMFYPGVGGDEGEDNSITFDGEQKTMKISGGPNGSFTREIKDLVRFWVDERKEIPCFLAAMTLEFYEKTTRAARM
ncbi:MAG: coiled-coil domain-containing protein mad1 [Peltula sp. TS41687]|nr:MAG: coiled-coil domain-containing protein mad1 [Peltula sp. TS41687]